MERAVTFKNHKVEITFSDMDDDNELEIKCHDEEEDRFYYLTKENVMSLKKHIDYLANKILLV